MTLYSHNGNYPESLPFRIILSNGNTRTDPSTFTDEEIFDAGYVSVDLPPTVSKSQVLEWDSKLISWNVRDKTGEEISLEAEKAWGIVRKKRNQLLSETDYVVIISHETNQPIEQRFLDYRQKLRNIPQDYENVEDIQWPELFPQEFYLNQS